MSFRGGRHYQASRHANNRGHQGGPRGNPEQSVKACKNFTGITNKPCHFDQGCKFQHRLRKVGSLEDAHSDMIYCLAAGPIPESEAPPGSFQLFTGSKDKTLKRWIVTPTSARTGGGAPNQMSSARSAIPEGLLPSDAIAPPPSYSPSHNNIKNPSDLVFYDIKPSNSTPFPCSVISVMYAADCLFCALQNGTIKGFVSGHGFDLIGHQKEVHAMTLVDQILITGDFAGVLCFWQPSRDPEGRPTFNLVSQLTLPTGIKCVREMQLPGPQGPVKTLWVGCVDRVVIVLLQTLQIAHQIQLPQTSMNKPEVCMEFIPFGSTLLAGGVSGRVFQLTDQGIQRESRCPEVMCMDGMLGDKGPVLAIGSRGGVISMIGLPNVISEPGEIHTGHEFTETLSVDAHRDNIRGVRVVDIPGQKPILVTVSEDKCINMWQFSQSDAQRPTPQFTSQRGGRSHRARY